MYFLFRQQGYGDVSRSPAAVFVRRKMRTAFGKAYCAWEQLSVPGKTFRPAGAYTDNKKRRRDSIERFGADIGRYA